MAFGTHGHQESWTPGTTGTKPGLVEPETSGTFTICSAIPVAYSSLVRAFLVTLLVDTEFKNISFEQL